jgi:hypothetical protein
VPQFQDVEDGPAVDVQVTSDVGAGNAQLPRSGEHSADRVRRSDSKHRARVGRTNSRAVIRLDADRQVAAEEPAEQGGH